MGMRYGIIWNFVKEFYLKFLLLKSASRCCKGCWSVPYPRHDTDCDILAAPYEAQNMQISTISYA